MEKITWLDKVTYEEVPGRVNKDRQMLNSIWQRRHWWIGHKRTTFYMKLLKAKCVRGADYVKKQPPLLPSRCWLLLGQILSDFNDFL